MSNGLIKIDKSDVVSYIHKNNAGMDFPKPFEREVFLYDTYISGANYVDELKDGRIALKAGDKLLFYRYVENMLDKNTIAIKTEGGVAVGYVPNKVNAIFASLMDAGKELFCKVCRVEERDGLLKIKITIYMND